MNWGAVEAIGEIVGAVAVVLTAQAEANLHSGSPLTYRRPIPLPEAPACSTDPGVPS